MMTIPPWSHNRVQSFPPFSRTRMKVGSAMTSHEVNGVTKMSGKNGWRLVRRMSSERLQIMDYVIN